MRSLDTDLIPTATTPSVSQNCTNDGLENCNPIANLTSVQELYSINVAENMCYNPIRPPLIPLMCQQRRTTNLIRSLVTKQPLIPL